MLASVNFNDDLSVEADKINDKAFNWNLPPKFEAYEAPVPQQSPHRQFGVGGATAQCFREIAAAFCNRTMLKSLRH